MSRWLAVITIISTAALGSCVSQSGDATGFAWSFQNNPGEGPKLAYGAPASDNVVVMMTCQAGAEQVNVSLLGGSPRDGLILISNGDRQTFKSRPAPSPGAVHMIEATAHVDAEPLVGFAQTGKLSIVDRGRTAKLDASPAEHADVTRFFEACRA